MTSCSPRGTVVGSACHCGHPVNKASPAADTASDVGNLSKLVFIQRFSLAYGSEDLKMTLALLKRPSLRLTCDHRPTASPCVTSISRNIHHAQSGQQTHHQELGLGKVVLEDVADVLGVAQVQGRVHLPSPNEGLEFRVYQRRVVAKPDSLQKAQMPRLSAMEPPPRRGCRWAQA